MAQTKLEVRTADGVMDVHLHPSPSGGRAPTVLFFFDAFGVRPTMHEMAERLASHGYCVALPNLFYRAGAYAPFDAKTVWTDAAEKGRLMALIKQTTTAGTMSDVGALLDALATRPEARADQVGAMGYCMGGRIAFTAAGAHPERVAAAASIHGGGLVSDEPDSPHRQAAAIRAKLYFAVAANDPCATPEGQAPLRAALDEAKVRYQLEVYPGAQHGFAVPDMPVYDAAAAEQHWERVLSLFAETLPRR
jgi:carboxymethylenebutenolidase